MSCFSFKSYRVKENLRALHYARSFRATDTEKDWWRHQRLYVELEKFIV